MLYFTRTSDGEDDAGMLQLHEFICAAVKTTAQIPSVTVDQAIAIDLYTAVSTLGHVRRPAGPLTFVRTLKLSAGLELGLFVRSKGWSPTNKRNKERNINRAVATRQLIDGELAQVVFDFDDMTVRYEPLRETSGDPTVKYEIAPGEFK